MPAQAKAIHSPSRTKARDDFAAWGRNHQKRSTLARSGECRLCRRAVRKRVMNLPLGAEFIRSAQLSRDEFAAWGRNHQKRSTTPQAKRIHSASRTEARDDFAAWGRNHQKRSTTRSNMPSLRPACNRKSALRRIRRERECAAACVEENSDSAALHSPRHCLS